MRIRNKHTGEIVDADFNATISGRTNIIIIQNGPELLEYGSLAELNEEWEDYEEPKTFWYIRCSGEVYEDESDASTEHGEKHKQIGNYFETKEEAEKVVERLRAWKRLKDKGVEFYGWRKNQTGTYELYMRWEDRIPRSYEVKNDLDLLFGGEE